MLHIRLKKRRNELKLSQEYVANQLGITRQGYGHYETGRNEPDSKTIVKLSEILKCTTDYLYGKTDRPESTVKEERDIAKRLDQIKNDIEHADGLSFSGEPMSDEAKDSLMDAMEFIVRQAKKINKKYTPKKYRKDDGNE